MSPASTDAPQLTTPGSSDGFCLDGSREKALPLVGA